MPPATFLHISDLHIGQTDGESLDARTPFWKQWPGFDGMLGHSADSLFDLQDALHTFREEEPQVIVTGDLTAVGRPQEFDLANQYLAGILRGPFGERVGLGVLNWSDRAIPGNHDQWPGRSIIIGRATPALKRYFPYLPLVQPVFQLGNGRQMRLLRIDTDADVQPYSPERIRAFGSFVSQLRTLAQTLSLLGPNENEIRVLCLHHSPSHRGPILEIDANSRTELNEFILNNRIAVLLCGHIHRPPLVKPFQVSPGLDVLEARCGTTSQIDPSIGRKAEHEGLVETHWQNSFLIHRLREFPREIHWETELYLESRGVGFVRADQLRDDIAPMTSFKVWPWPPQLLLAPIEPRRPLGRVA